MTLSTVLFTATRLIKATITGAKEGIAHELNVISWEKDMDAMEIFDGYEGWIEVEDDDMPDNAMVMCIGCDNMIEYDECEPFCMVCIKESYQRNEYHMDTCCIETTGTCNCDLPF